MSQFYARYVPPVSKTPPTLPASTALTEKRKRAEPTVPHVKKNKKVKLSNGSREENRFTSPPNAYQKDQLAGNKRRENGTDILSKYRATAGKNARPDVDPTLNAPSSDDAQIHRIPHPEDEGKGGKKRKAKDTTKLDVGTGMSEEPINKHASIYSKLEQARQQERAPLENDNDNPTDASPTELHGLEPIPQPEQKESVPIRPTYSTLPPWQKTPLEVALNVRHSFKSLGVPDAILKNLQKQGLENAFPIQSAVLPLLLGGGGEHDGDLCVSAGTGSGKTLSYVLPIIASLKELSGTKLRAVIVVPTRELVKQVRELCEICAASSRLKIATAVGSSSLKDEQDLLVLEEDVYDPDQYDLQQRSRVDWAPFSLDRLVRRSYDEDPLNSVGFVTQYRSKVDIVITTPGRLVDHLKSTPGFNLDDVKWLVIDEADRLLNESYQEWIEVVSPALASNCANAERDRLLRSMRMAPPRRKVKKILLSATMTTDISKLNPLGLFEPKLVLLRSSTNASLDEAAENTSNVPNPEELPTGTGGSFHLPGSLIESVVPILEPSQKPLYLVQLLEQELKLAAGPPNLKNCSGDSAADAASSTSSSDSSSSTPSDEDDSESSSSSDSSEASTDSLPSPGTEQIEVPSTKLASRALIFTRSTAAANRLARLLSLLKPSWSGRISTLTRSTASSGSSRRALSAFRNSKLSVLIATDRASRGLDVPGLEHVISYDVPSSALTYVHRVGRTARAGKSGHAWTFLEHREGAWFWREIGGKVQSRNAVAENRLHRESKVKRTTISIEDNDLHKEYEEALQQLGREARG
ncbi:uncharacterized protein A1O9_07093 [Exophiala aquamarina CBS 119918]|uniref:ATP-dependent RNA helicase n=1 Tax=Exophiala aquamarina CBS 119918 TaxID=1182545 RepID=A0A072PC87_9EURO|nr:uncharacterized protein A1O9_07093 [Exophiala aquamarina CBS 119918]KEF56903.1 hypothetical protein A1O9_07093 [Exophiala aquamarina CBS 119918]